MIIGGSKKEVIANIRLAAEEGRLNDKVEVGDPKISKEERQRLVYRYLKKKNTVGYKLANIAARAITDTATRKLNKDTEIIGLEKIKDIRGGAIVTSNHFNPLDNTVVRYAMNKAKHRRLFVVSQDTNLAMKGWIGFLMNHEDILPILYERNYMQTAFEQIISSTLRKKEVILIYPEQEMWFNYRKPRTPKRGTYYYAAQNNVPVISCFVEMIDQEAMDNEEFRQVRYVMHILDPIYPKKGVSLRENSIYMMEQDYKQKKEAYEAAYHKKLTYEYEENDIAGWTGDEKSEQE